MLWCRKPGSNRYEKESHGILSPGRLPIPPFRHTASVDAYYIIARKCRFVKGFFGILSAFSDFSGRQLFFLLLCTEFYAEGDAFIRFLRSIKVSASHADVSIPHGRYRQNAANAHLACRLQVGIGTKRMSISSETAEHHFTLCPVVT
mgnify:CR=1 FL=1